MTDILSVSTDFDLKPFSHVLPSLEKAISPMTNGVMHSHESAPIDSSGADSDPHLTYGLEAVAPQSPVQESTLSHDSTPQRSSTVYSHVKLSPRSTEAAAPLQEPSPRHSLHPSLIAISVLHPAITIAQTYTKHINIAHESIYKGYTPNSG